MNKKENKWQKIVEEIEENQKEESKQDVKESADKGKIEDEETVLTSEEAVSIEYPTREELERDLTKAEIKLADVADRLARAQAELENVRRRSERDISRAHKYGSEKLLIDMLPVIDSLVRGLEGAPASDSNLQSMREGMRLTLDLLIKTLEKHGVERIAPVKGDSFNPELHEAVSVVPDPDAKSHTIVELLQQGFMLNGRVLRAAMVVVAQ